MTTMVLVTGGGGFIGSHLCEQLLHDGHDVVCLDNFSTGRGKNIRHLQNHSGFKVLIQDVVDPVSIAPCQIFNLACPASPLHYQKDPIRTIRTSVLGAINMLDLVRKNNAPILQASTSEVYGDPQIHPQPESYWGYVNPIGPRSCYDEGKRMAESLFFAYTRTFSLAIKIVRIFNTYGPRMSPEDNRVVPNFILQALTHQDLTIYGDGLQIRSFCYIDDLVNGIVRMMQTDNPFAGPLNLGNPTETTILHLAEMILRLARSH